MKYRFSSLDQILHSPLFDFSASYQPPKRTDRSTRPTRLGDMDFEAARAPYDPDVDDLLKRDDFFAAAQPLQRECVCSDGSGTRLPACRAV